MYTIKENLRPLVQQYNNWLNGFYLSGILRFKGHQQGGADYISKVFKAQSHQIRSRWQNAVKQTQNPTFSGFIKDNISRIVLLNAAERLVTAYQAAPLLSRINRPNTLSFLATQIMNDGAFRGTLRGISINFLQASLILWPSVYITNMSNGGLPAFLLSYSILDTLLYPLDTLKTKMYANTANPLGLRSALNQMSFTGAYKGLISKLIFNIPLLAALYGTSTNSEYSPFLWLATALAYPLNTIKVTMQAGQTLIPGGFNAFRGVVPFILVNYFFAWQLTALFNRQKLDKIKNEVIEQTYQKLGYV